VDVNIFCNDRIVCVFGTGYMNFSFTKFDTSRISENQSYQSAKFCVIVDNLLLQLFIFSRFSQKSISNQYF